ncbi:MAG: hypothetical protein WEG40_09855 [Candidatus Rokuibacteriota bacterium]
MRRLLPVLIGVLSVASFLPALGGQFLTWDDDFNFLMPLAWGAAAAALVFALHPLRVESVAWITERRDVLSGFFFLTAVLAYLRGVEAGGGIEAAGSHLERAAALRPGDESTRGLLARFRADPERPVRLR